MRSAALSLVFFVNVLCCQAAQLTGSFVPLPSGFTADLSAEGTLDWAHWGLNSPTEFNHRAGTNQLISDYVIIGSASPSRANSFPTACSWTNGTPVVSATSTTTAAFVTGLNNGFQIVVGATTSPRRLRLYVGGLAGKVQLQASLSDGSAPPYVDNSLDSLGLTNGVYTLAYVSGSAGQTLTVKLTLQTAYDSGSAAAVLQAATLAIITNQSPLVSLTSPSNETNYLVGASIPIAATATDPDGTVAQVEFFDGTTSLAHFTNIPYQFTWSNAAPGIHSLTAIATDNLGASTTSQPLTVFVYTGLGSLTSSLSLPANPIDLSSEGTADWAHWGLLTPGSFDHKAGVLQQIDNYTSFGGPVYNFSDNLEGCSWTGGTPTASANDTHTGVYAAGLGAGFQVTAAADTTVKTLKLYVGAFGARGRLQAYLSDLSTPVYFDSSLENAGNGPSGVYTINYRAASAGKKLVLRFRVVQMDDSSGNVTLQSATLVGGNNPPFASITNPPSQSAIRAPSSIVIGAQASDPDGNIAKLEFYQGATKLGEATNSPYFYSWTNVPAGNYSLTVRAFDNQNATFTSSPIDFYVTNSGGFLSGRLASAPAAANLTSEGTLDWGHWGLVRFNSFNHKIGGTQIGGVALLDATKADQYSDNFVKFSWSNGTPVLSATDSPTGIFVNGLGNGFQFTIPADTKERRLKIYLGLYGAHGRFQAALSDFSSIPYTDESLISPFGNSYGVYTIDFAAASAGKSLIVTYISKEIFDTQFGNVTWQAATLHYPVILMSNLHSANGQFSFTVSSELNTLHDVEYSASLSGPWVMLTNFVTTGADVLVTDPAATGPMRFYHVRTE